MKLGISLSTYRAVFQLVSPRAVSAAEHVEYQACAPARSAVVGNSSRRTVFALGTGRARGVRHPRVTAHAFACATDPISTPPVRRKQHKVLRRPHVAEPIREVIAENTAPTIRSAAALVVEVSAATRKTSTAFFMLSFPRAAVGLRRMGRVGLSVQHGGRARNRRCAKARERLNRHQIGFRRIRPGTMWSAAVTVSRESRGNAGEARSSFRVRHRTPGD